MKKLLLLTSLVLVNLHTAYSQWQTCSPCGTCTVKSVYEFSGAIYAGTLGSGIFSSINNGDNWSQINSGLSNLNINAICADTTGMLYAASKSLTIFTSADTGALWVSHSMGGTGTEITSVIAVGSKIIAGQKFDGVFVSSTQGSTWSEVALCCASVLSLCSDTTGKVYAGTNTYTLNTANDPFTSWGQLAPGFTHSPVSSLLKTETLIMAGTLGGGIYISDNNGTSFTASSVGLTNLQVTSLAGNDQKMFAGTIGGGVFLSIDKGLNWLSCNEGLTSLQIATLTVSGNYLFAGLTNGGAWRRLLSEMTNIENDYQNHTFKIYPVPAKDFVTIDFPSNNNARIEIYDSEGRLIKQSKIQDSRENINIQLLSKGIYLIKIIDDNSVSVQKLVKN